MKTSPNLLLSDRNKARDKACNKARNKTVTTLNRNFLFETDSRSVGNGLAPETVLRVGT